VDPNVKFSIFVSFVTGILTGAFFGGLACRSWDIPTGGSFLGAAFESALALYFGCALGGFAGGLIGITNGIARSSLLTGVFVGTIFGCATFGLLVRMGLRHNAHNRPRYPDLRDVLYLLSPIPLGALVGSLSTLARELCQ